MNKKYKTMLMVLSLALLLTPVFFAFAQSPVIPTGVPVSLQEVLRFINRTMQLLVTFGVVIGVIFIVIGGIQYMLAGDKPEKAKAARDRVINGLIGVGIVLGIGVLIQTVNAIINRSFFN